MMNSKERVLAALSFKRTDRLPRNLWILPAAARKFREQHQRLIARYPMDISHPRYHMPIGSRQQGNPETDYEYVDKWGCGWKTLQAGIIGEVVHPPIREWSDLDSYEPPYEVLGKGMEEVNRSCEKNPYFLLGCTQPRLFERCQFLRGTEQFMLDLAYGDERVRGLIERVADYYKAELEIWSRTDVDALGFMDDWGTQKGLLISPAMWREYFKPHYRDFCQIIRSGGKSVFMHSDGMIEAIYPDLIEIGVQVLNSQLFCMDIEKLGRLYGGKIVFHGEIDRQHILPKGTREEVRAAVRRLRQAFSGFEGGVIALCEWGPDCPPENIEAVYEEFDRWYE